MVVVRKILAVFLLAACGSTGQTSRFSDTGALCFHSTPSGSVVLGVAFPGCLSSSCSKVTAALCRITEKDGAIKVTSYGEVKNENDECTDDCGSLTTRCESAPIAPGTYTVTYGDQTTELTLPATRETRFASSAVFPPPCE
jgi:hypothetical protein